MKRREVGLLLFLCCSSPGCSGGDSPLTGPGASNEPAFVCTEVIGFSQTAQWYKAGFESGVQDATWQLLWHGGASIDRWADPAYDGWFPARPGTERYSACANGAANPDRVVLTISGNFNADPAWWADQMNVVISLIRARYPGVRRILLQPVVGGPGHATCGRAGTGVRASVNHPVIDAAIRRVVGRDVVTGADPLVRSCDDYSDATGHLTSAAAGPIGAEIARFYGR